GHRQHPWVIGVEQRHAAGGQRGGQFTLGPRHLRQAAELAGVGVPDTQHDAKRRPRDPALPGDMACPARRKLQQQVPRGGGDPQGPGAGDPGYGGQRERDDSGTPHGSGSSAGGGWPWWRAIAAAATSRSSKGITAVPVYWPRSCPLPATTTTSPLPAIATA